MVRAALKATLDWLYPPSCLICAAAADAQGGMCGACWRDMRWIEGAACAICAAPFSFDVGPAAEEGRFEPPSCAQCAESPRGWRRGAAVCLYEGAGGKLVLALKHGDRHDAARAMGAWMARAGRSLLTARAGAPPVLVTPTPLHWTRRVGRRFNQALELARATADASEAELAPDLLRRTRGTPSQAGRGRAGRISNVAGAFDLAPGAAAHVSGRRVVLIDDVMTTGATLSACAERFTSAGAESVDILVFARAARDPFAPSSQHA